MSRSQKVRSTDAGLCQCTGFLWIGRGAKNAVLGGVEKRFVYILRSDRNPTKHYVGVTSDVHERSHWHNTGLNVHTARDRPWHVIVSIEFRTQEAALEFERYLKTGSGRAFAKRHVP